MKPLTKKLLLAVFFSIPLICSGQNNHIVLGGAGKASLSVNLSGGSFVDFRLNNQSPNPFSWNIPIKEMPQNNRNGVPFQGHFLCLGRWGAPTEGEIKAGVPHNGQSGNQLWKITEQSADSSLCIHSEAPLDGVIAERKIYFDKNNAVFQVTDYIESTLTTGRLFNIVQHSTIGVPFLSPSTIIDSNADRGFMQHLSFPDPHQYEYTWPKGIADSSGKTIDLTRTDTPLSYVSTHLFNEKTGWITASGPDCGLLIGYIWDTSDYPWLNIWHEMKNGYPHAKGLEFGTTGIGRSYQDLLAKDTRFHGKNSFFFLDALEQLEKSFICFQIEIPKDYKGVKSIELKGEEIILTEKGDSDPRKTTIKNKFYQHYISIKNNTSKTRIDEPFIIKRSDIKYEEKGKLPALKNKNGDWITCQVDDLNKDGEWDELAFVYSLKASESDTLFINWVLPQTYPAFTPRTNVRFGKMISPGNITILETDIHGKYNLSRGEGYPYQTDGPAWENDKAGFRHYFDGRNVRDVFGKRTPLMVMDTVGIQADGTPGDTYHQLHWWGRDIMSGAASLGLGGIALNTKDSLIRLGITINETTDNIDSTRYILVTKGPVRSIFQLDFYGWDISKGKKINVHETMTIWAGKYGYENVIQTSPLPNGSKLVTGIVNNFNDQPYVFEKAGKYRMMSTHDKQTYDKVWYLGMSLLIDEKNFVNTFEAPKNGNGITTTWCANLKPDKEGKYRFNCYAAWELSDPRFIDAGFYFDMIRNYAESSSNQLKLTVH